MTTSTIESVIKQALKTFSFTNKDTLENFNKNFSKLLSQVSNISSEDIHFENYLLTQQVREIKRYRSDKVSNSIKVDVYHINRAPVTYIQIFENELVTLGVFVIREGHKLPLHNHPLMHGIIKVLAGTLKISSYSVLDPNNTGNTDEGGGTNVHQFDIPGLGMVPIPCYKEMSSTQGSNFQTQTDSHPTSYCPHSILSYLESPNVFLASSHPPLLLSSEDNAKYLTPRARNLHEISCVNGPAAFLDVIGPPYKPVTLQDCTYFEDVGELSADNKSIRMLHRISCPSYFYTDEEKYKGPPINV
ncbi:hypothetical protein M8J76_003561 [Diaphorina citri]|nr:hypothetical protein M8J76_003561 [Diaphorina citri]